MAHLDRFPHAITPKGEYTVHAAVMSHMPIIAMRDFGDTDPHPLTDEDKALIEAERSACGEE